MIKSPNISQLIGLTPILVTTFDLTKHKLELKISTHI